MQSDRQQQVHRQLFCLFQIASYRIMVGTFNGAVYSTVIRVECRRVQNVVDSVEHLVAVIAESWSVATAHISIDQFFAEQFAGVRDG